MNGKRVNIGSMRIKVGDIVEVKENPSASARARRIGAHRRDVPDYVEAGHSKMTAKLTRIPTLSEVPYPVMMEPHLVVEYYSR